MKFTGVPSFLISKLCSLDQAKVYEIEVNEPKAKRSIEQNKKLWKMIHEIAHYTNQDDMDIYVTLLEHADAKSDYVICKKDLESELRTKFRGVKFVRTFTEKGEDFNIYKVYIGSSKMNVKEMYELIEIAEEVSSELGIPVGD